MSPYDIIYLKSTIVTLLHRFFAALDDLYYRLYYSTSLTFRLGKFEGECPIPMPHIFFTSCLVDEDTINKKLESVMKTNFSDNFKEHIIRIFGLSSEYMHENPLLCLHFSRWRESMIFLHEMLDTQYTNIPELLEECFLPPIVDAPQNATMKPLGDPLLPPLLRVWNDSCRTWSCHLYAYATPSTEALDILAKYSPLVEIGAGMLSF